MKKYLAVTTTITLGISMLFLSSVLAAEEAKQSAVQQVKSTAEEIAQPAVADETEFSYGTVKSIGTDQLVISEYDYDSDKDVEVTYSAPAGTKFENVTALQEIKAGDAVDIDFLVKNGQKVASAITVEKPTAEDEDVALGADAGADAGTDTGAAGEPGKPE